MQEEWKPIDAEEKYFVSTLGEVYSSKSNKTLKQFADKQGYLQVDINGKCVKIHRLVAKAFIPNISNYRQVNHIDECKSNNCVSNLEWCDAKYNSNYGTRNQRMKKALSHKVIQLDSEMNVIRVWDSVMDAERSGYTGSCISKCCNGKRNSHKGYKWIYAERVGI